MAEGDDKMEVPSSIYLKSEAVSEVFCEPCRETTKSNVAEWFCVDCSEYLCGHCYIYHERYKRLENHVVHDKDHMPLDKKQVKLKDVCVTKCRTHNDKVIEYVCMSCDKIGCNVCMTIDHRSCEDVRYIPDAVTNPNIHREVQEFAKKLDNKDRELQNLQNKISNNLELTNDMYMKAMMDLDKQRDQIFAFFESLYDKQKLDIQEKQITDTSSIETSLNETVSMQTDLHKNKSQMNALEQSAQKCELYIFMKNTESTWEKMTSDMLKLLEKGKEITVRYESSAEVEEMLQGDIKYLGHLVNGEESQKSQKKLKLKKTSMKKEVKSVPQGKEDHEAAHLEIKTLNEGQKQEKIDLVTVTAEPEQREVKPNTPEVSEPVEVTPRPSVPEEPVAEVTAKPLKAPSPTPTDESIPKEEIKIEDGNDVELVKVDIEDDEGEEVMSKRLRYKYSEEQWSPLNPKGKKHYDREFLLQFQNEYFALQKPAGLPDIPDIILDEPQRMGRQFRRESSWGSGGEPDFIEFTHKYVWGGGGGGAGGQKSHGLPRQPSNQKNKGGPPPLHINVSVSKDIELDNTKDARKPSHTDSKRESDEDDAKTMTEVPSESKPGKMVNFSSVLLSRCEREFAKNISSEAPFFQNNQQNMNVRPQRYHRAGNPQSMIYGGPQMIYAMQGGQFPGQQPIIMNAANMIPQQRMTNPQYNPGGMPSNQPGYIHQIPQQQPPISYPQGYGNQPLFIGSTQASQRPPSTQGLATHQYTKPKEKKHIISIVDPSSGKDMTAEILKTQSPDVTGSSDSGSRSTPIGSTEEVTGQSGESNAIAAQFAAQVAAKLYHPKDGEGPPSQTPPSQGAVPGAIPSGDHAHQTVTGSNTVQAVPEQPTPTQSVHIDSATTDSSKTPQSLSNGRPAPLSEVVRTSEVPPVAVAETVTPVDSASNAKKSLETSEPVTVSVISAPVVSERTNVSEERSDSSSGREMTPEVNIVPPTPVEKKPDMEIPETCEEPTKNEEPVTEVSVPKKQKSKLKKKDLNKKGEQISGSEFDAYTDSSVPAEPEQPEVKPSTPEVSEPVEATPKPSVPEEPVAEVTTEPSKTPSPTPTDDSIPKVEIKIEDGSVELEEGEIVDDEEEVDMNMGLRYKYSEEQWSPLNPEGKKHYDREFLLQFQNEYSAVQKPAGLPDIPDIILDKPQGMGRQFSRDSSGGSGGGTDFIDFTPKYVWGGGGGGGGGQKSRGLPRQPSNQKNKGGPPPRHINVSISKDIELHKAKEAWKPSHTDAKKENEEDDAKTLELYKKTRSILNKLTPQKFQTLVTQMQSLPIDSESKLKGVIDLVFEKAISEPSFSVAYANMCRCLSMSKVPSESKPGEMVNFRAVLLTRCQREFEKDKSSEAVFMAKREEIEKAEDGAKKEELKQELEYEESKAKRRSLGNIRFIGELFKLKMLTENIMHDCVFKLLRTKDPENLECLCRLLTTIGKELDVDKAKPRMDQYFQQMGKIVNEKKTSSRVRFMLQDVIDLRTNKWVPRRVDNNPKTIDQIHKEVAQEAQEKALLSQQNQMQQRAQRGGRRGGPEQRGGADGWNTVGANRTPLKSVDRSIDPSKMKLSKQSVDESNIQLGPGGGASRFSGWGRGSTGGTTSRPSQEKEKPNTPANRFSALSRPDEEQGRRFGGVSPARSDSRGRGFGRPPSLGARRSQETERERAVAAAKAIGASQSVDGGHRERSRGRAEQEPQPTSVQPASAELKVLSEQEMEKKTKAILDEYFAIQDMKEAILCVQELSTQNHHHFVYNAINHVLERSSVARKQTGHILHDLVKQSVVSVDNYIKGLVEVLEYAEDLEIDIPKIWQYYGELISPMIQDNSVPLSFLKQAAAPLIANNKAGILLAEILHDASHREGHKKVAGLWTSSGLQWSDFVPKNQVEQFLKDKGLEYTSGGDSVPTTPTTGLPLSEIEVKLQELIVAKKADNETVFDWIEGNVDDPTTKRAKFIRSLMTAVCLSAIKGDKGKERLDPKEISARNDLLQKYLDHQADSELQALYAVQALIAKLEHPQGVLRTMFDTLYDEDIISEDAFFQWEKSEDEPEGKGVCLKQAIQFFTWLREADEDS